MIKDLAYGVKVRDVIYDTFMQKFVVSNINQSENTVIFTVIDTGLNTHYYSYEDMYFEDLHGESDEEKSWINWVKDNKEFVNNFDHLSTIKWIYKQGFAEGFVYNQKVSCKEMMQK